MRISSLGKNLINQVVTFYDELIWFDSTLNQVIIGYNMGLMPQQFTLFGELNGSRVFEIQKQNPLYPTMPGFWEIVAGVGALVGIGVAVWAALRTHTTTSRTYNYDANNNLIGYSVTYTTDPNPFEIIVDGQTYLVDDFGINYSENLQSPDDQNLVPYNTAFQITGVNLNSLEITSII